MREQLDGREFYVSKPLHPQLTYGRRTLLEHVVQVCDRPHGRRNLSGYAFHVLHDRLVESVPLPGVAVVGDASGGFDIQRRAPSCVVLATEAGTDPNYMGVAHARINGA